LLLLLLLLLMMLFVVTTTHGTAQTPSNAVLCYATRTNASGSMMESVWDAQLRWQHPSLFGLLACLFVCVIVFGEAD